MNRREFLALSAAALMTPLVARAQTRLKLLILGGTGFIGPHQVEAALGRGHSVTLFNRGRTGPELFPHLENLVGDRDRDLSALRGRRWDVVIDNSGFLPRWVRQSAEALKGQVDHYIYTSSVSAYRDFSKVGMIESSPLARLKDPNTEERSAANYGGMKALSESIVTQHFSRSSTLVRPGLVVGPGDPTDRFTYWPVRMHQGGEALAPGTPQDPIQCIDVRDLARWMILAAEERLAGPFHITGPYHQMTMGEFLESTQKTINSKTNLSWVDADFLLRKGVRPWTDLPMWVPPNSDSGGILRLDNTKAIEAGLTFRPMASTVRDALAWYRTLHQPAEPLKAGLSPKRELELLNQWKAEATLR